MMEDALLYQLALSFLPGLKPQESRQLLDRFGTAKAVFQRTDFEAFEDLNPKIKAEIRQGSTLKRAEEELRHIEIHRIQTHFINDENYPLRLQSCPDAPILLYSKGFSNLNEKKILAIVGTRKATHYGKTLTERLVTEIAHYFPETIIISGLAYGIDIRAHQTALENGLNTVAVVAHGLQEIYPTPHRAFATKMLENGSILTELPWNTPSMPWRFVQRNRIVAGLCDACVVVESSCKGGSLITAQMAADYSREVFAFPGRTLDEHSKGCNFLIKKQIACLVESAEDIIREMNWDTFSKKGQKQTKLFPELQPAEEKLYQTMSLGEKHSSNDLAKLLHCKIGETLSSLIQLEMLGLVEALPGGFYLKKEC